MPALLGLLRQDLRVRPNRELCLMYVFKPQGVCPAEIHFALENNAIKDVRMVGGGCIGNSQLIAGLLEGMDVDKALPFLRGIVCRNGTSCPDQLGKALLMAQNGEIAEADPITTGIEEAGELLKLAVISEAMGDSEGIERVYALSKAEGAQALYSLGNLTRGGGDGADDAAVELAVKKGIRVVQGPIDRMIALGRFGDHGAEVSVKQANRDRLLITPLIRMFNLGDRHGVAFHGGFIQDLPGFSDFGPYASEILSVCYLSDYLRDESVFPAMETMLKHFSASIVLFGTTGEWKHVRLGEVDMINVGSLRSGEFYRYALIEWTKGGVVVQFRSTPVEN